MTYVALAGGGVQRNDGACIPEDERNTDWQEYLQWVRDGGITGPVKNAVAWTAPEMTALQTDLLVPMTVKDYLAKYP